MGAPAEIAASRGSPTLEDAFVAYLTEAEDTAPRDIPPFPIPHHGREAGPKPGLAAAAGGCGRLRAARRWSCCATACG